MAGSDDGSNLAEYYASLALRIVEETENTTGTEAHQPVYNGDLVGAIDAVHEGQRSLAAVSRETSVDRGGHTSGQGRGRGSRRGRGRVRRVVGRGLPPFPNLYQAEDGRRCGVLVLKEAQRTGWEHTLAHRMKMKWLTGVVHTWFNGLGIFRAYKEPSPLNQV